MSAPYYRVDPNLVKREVDEDGALLFHPDYNLVKVVNTTGLFILDQLDGKTSEDAISDRLMEEFEVTAEEAKADVGAFIEELAGHRLIGKVVEI